MRSGTIAFLLGIVFLQQHAELPHPFWALLPAMLLLLRFHWRWVHFPLFLVAGYCWALLYAHWTLLQSLPEELEGKDIQIVGEVISIPEVRQIDFGYSNSKSQHSPQDLRFLFRVDSISYEGKALSGIHLPLKIRLSWYASLQQVKAGEAWQFIVRLKQPNGFMNPGGFDYEGWLFLQGIRASGYVRENSLNIQLPSPSCSICLDRWRQYTSDHLDKLLEYNEQKGVIKALVTGERSGITPDQWVILAQTGTSHLLAISGLHIGLVAGLAYWFFNWLWSRSYRCTLWLPAPKAAAAVAILFALVYAALAGFSIPTRRAFIMVAVAMVGVVMGRATYPSHLLALAMIAVLILDPVSVLSMGFWLSFIAVAVILYGMSARIGASGLWWKWGRVQWLVFVGLLPLVMLFFQRLSLLSPIANLVAVPIVSILVVPLVLMATLVSLLNEVLATSLFVLVQYLLQAIWIILAGLGSLPYSLWTQVIASGGVLASVVLGVVILLAPDGFPRKLGAIFLLPLLFYRQEIPDETELWLTVLDVGQGLAVVVQTRNHAMLYDTGPRFGAQFNAGEAVIIPYLRHQGLDYLDTVVVSHSNLDHSGGLGPVIEAIPIGHLMVGESLPGDSFYKEASGELINNAGSIRYGHCVEGNSWVWDKVTFEIMHPPPGYTGNHNNHSCVIRISSMHGSVLLTGDLDRQVEKRLLESKGERLASGILVAPHHGSNSSSTRAFISRVDPQYVVFSSGYRNRFAHPRPEVIARYRKQNAVLSNTSTHGAIQYRLGVDGGISGPVEYRLAQRRYWNRWISQKSPFYPTVQ